jgi:uncharacterized membrane protein YfcA
MDLNNLLLGSLIGFIGGGASGLMGVSSGGFLVALSAILLGVEQHVAQGISLVAQVPPTSLSGVMHYRRSGHDIALRWVILLAAGFIIGGVAGALGAGAMSEPVLRWLFVGYLVVLGTLAALRPQRDAAAKAGPPVALGAAVLIGTGIVSGLSSGLLGIGGGLAITALLGAGMKVPQHQAQALGLAITTLPLTLPSAWVYAEQSRALPWWTIAGVIVGLWIGTIGGARLANLMSARLLRRLLVAFTWLVAAFMAWRAW